MTIALYPGSFDPVTYGHLDIATRATSLFNELVIGICDAPRKHLLFTTEERVQLVREAVGHLPNVRVEPYSGLTIEFARKIKARVIVRGLRMGSDFEREFEMAMMNKKLAPEIELACFMASLEYEFISSHLLKEVAELGGSISCLVPEHVAEALTRKFSLEALER